MQDRATELEGRVAALEAEIAHAEESLGNFVSVDESLRLSTHLDKLRRDLDESMREWESLSSQIEATA